MPTMKCLSTTVAKAAADAAAAGCGADGGGIGFLTDKGNVRVNRARGA